ncbi:hypothetical protein [Nonomuraea recticatena]|uniref:hypothetical protein n=1 Tax=Nonomuraea recticatena TaxID=46178 RepID=UPI0036161E0B
MDGCLMVLPVPGRWPAGERMSALNEFTGALVEEGGRITRDYSFTAAGMYQSVNAVREADAGADEVADAAAGGTW